MRATTHQTRIGLHREYEGQQDEHVFMAYDTAVDTQRDNAKVAG